MYRMREELVTQIYEHTSDSTLENSFINVSRARRAFHENLIYEHTSEFILDNMREELFRSIWSFNCDTGEEFFTKM
jgi:hypothetical protein